MADRHPGDRSLTVDEVGPSGGGDKPYDLLDPTADAVFSSPAWPSLIGHADCPVTPTTMPELLGQRSPVVELSRSPTDNSLRGFSSDPTGGEVSLESFAARRRPQRHREPQLLAGSIQLSSLR